jgi:hypothetical protein
VEGIIVGDFIEAKGSLLKFHKTTVYCKKMIAVFQGEFGIVSDIPSGDGKPLAFFTV